MSPKGALKNTIPPDATSKAYKSYGQNQSGAEFHDESKSGVISKGGGRQNSCDKFYKVV